MNRYISKLRKRVIRYFLSSLDFSQDIEKALILQGKHLTLLLPGKCNKIREAEFQVFSQWGEDGIIQYIIKNISMSGYESFIEFGVEDYSESNTRFLLMNNNWRGLVIDGSVENIYSIRTKDYSWRHNLTAIPAFITKGNINKLISDAGFAGEVGILSVDIDGNDFWIWESINVISPRIVIAEYNGLWGATDAVSVPYDDGFVRGEKHHSNLYYGCSLGALVVLGKRKGYSFIGSNSTGSNAFFIRNDLMANFKEVSIQQEFVFRSFREGRDINGVLSFDDKSRQLKAVADLPLVNINTGGLLKVADLK